MAARITALNAPSALITGSGPFKITPTISDPDNVITWTGTDETGASVSGTTTVHENVTLSTDPTKKGHPGYIVLEASASDGSTVALSVDPNGVAWDSSV